MRNNPGAKTVRKVLRHREQSTQAPLIAPVDATVPAVSRANLRSTGYYASTLNKALPGKRRFYSWLLLGFQETFTYVAGLAVILNATPPVAARVETNLGSSRDDGQNRRILVLRFTEVHG